MADQDGRVLRQAQRLLQQQARTAQEQRVIDLRMRGWNYRRIAADLGITAPTVGNILERVYSRLPAGASRVAELRKLENDRIDALQDAIWDRAIGGEMGAIDRTLKLMERRAAINGLDAPTRVDVHYTEERISIQVRLAAIQRGLSEEEADQAVEAAVRYLREIPSGGAS